MSLIQVLGLFEAIIASAESEVELYFAANDALLVSVLETVVASVILMRRWDRLGAYSALLGRRSG